MEAVERPLKFRNLEMKNRVLRSGTSTNLAFLDWELRFAEAGIGAIISPRAEVRPTGHASELPALHPAWQEHIGQVHAYRCPYILRIGHGNLMHAAPLPAPTAADLRAIARAFADAARVAREAGADGVEIDGGRGTIIAQFLGPGWNDRPEAYQGSHENRRRLAREIVQAVRRSVGPAFHLQVRLGASSPLGMMAAGTLELIGQLEEDGIDAVHLTPDGSHPGAQVDRVVAFATRYVKGAAKVPVLRNGMFRAPEDIRAAIDDGSCDAVTLTRPLARQPAVADPGSQQAA